VGLPIKQMMEQMSIRPSTESDEASVYDLITLLTNSLTLIYDVYHMYLLVTIR